MKPQRHDFDDPTALRDMMLDYIADLMREHEGSGFVCHREPGVLAVRDEEGDLYDVSVTVIKGTP